MANYRKEQRTKQRNILLLKKKKSGFGSSYFEPKFSPVQEAGSLKFSNSLLTGRLQLLIAWAVAG